MNSHPDQAELALLLEAIAQTYGYDFREYSEASLQRRLVQWLSRSGCSCIEEARSRILGDPEVFEGLLRGLTVNVSEMFRDPQVFKALREQVTPHLKTYPFVKIWHAGCARGEEAYSMAIVLEEEGLNGRYCLYATDVNREALSKAREGVFPVKDMQLFTRNYQQSGGRSSFSDYYTARYDRALLSPLLKQRMVFASHNLAVDHVFGEMQLVLCRNVLIYFKKQLKDRALRLFDSSLAPGGFLCLGMQETLDGREIAPRYREIAPGTRIYRKGYQ